MVGMTYLASALLSLVLKNLVGRRLLLLTSQLGMAVSHLGLGLYFHQLPDTEEEMEESGLTWLPLPLVLAFTVSYNLGLGSLTWVVAHEILPVTSRGWTHTLANLASNFCWFIVLKTFRDLQDSLSRATPFFIYGGVCLFGLVFIYTFLPETRGKSPEETAKLFGSGRCCTKDGPKDLSNMKKREKMTTQNTAN